MSDGLIELQMPQMGESVTEGTILEWHVAEGEEVAEGDTVVEVSTDKIDAEVPAPASGVITKILAQPDDTVEVGQVLAQIDPTAGGNGADPSPLKDAEGELVTGGGEGDEDLGDDSVESASAQPGQIETPVAEAEADDRPSADPAAPGGEAEAGGTLVVAMPEMGESVTEGTVLEWHVSEGQTVDEGDTVIEVSTDKVDAEVPAPASGTITKLLVNVDDTVQVGQALAEMAAGAGNGASAAAPAPAETETETETPPARAGRGRSGQRQGLAGRPPDRRRQGHRPRRGQRLRPGRQGGQGGRARRRRRGNGAGPAVGGRRRRGRSRCAARRRCSPRRWTSRARCRPRPRSGPSPVDTLDAKRKAINGALKDRGMKVSFTHLIAWAIVRAATEWPVMGRSYSEVDGKPQVVEAPAVNLGIAVDVERKGGPQPDGPVHQGRRERSTSPPSTRATRS